MFRIGDSNQNNLHKWQLADLGKGLSQAVVGLLVTRILGKKKLHASLEKTIIFLHLITPSLKPTQHLKLTGLGRWVSSRPPGLPGGWCFQVGLSSPKAASCDERQWQRCRGFGDCDDQCLGTYADCIRGYVLGLACKHFLNPGFYGGKMIITYYLLRRDLLLSFMESSVFFRVWQDPHGYISSQH